MGRRDVSTGSGCDQTRHREGGGGNHYGSIDEGDPEGKQIDGTRVLGLVGIVMQVFVQTWDRSQGTQSQNGQDQQRR